jgi:transcriptional regulator GlxA family with amidase domain
MRCEVIALDGIFDTGLSTVLDVFTTANELIGLFDLGIPPFDVSVVGVRRRVRTAQGLSVPLTIRTAGAPADWVVVPALGFRTPEALEPVLARPDVRAASALLREHANRPNTRIAAACIGTFVLAESGLLTDQNATTTWWLGSLFRQRYPRVRLNESQMIVASGRLVLGGSAADVDDHPAIRERDDRRLALENGLTAEHVGVEAPRALDVAGHDEVREHNPFLGCGELCHRTPPRDRVNSHMVAACDAR